MAIDDAKKLLAELSADEFVGRNRELGSLYRHATKPASAGGLLLRSAPRSGASELLRQVFDRLFYDQADVVPFYFSVPERVRSAAETAESYLHECLLQLVAFRRRSAAIISSHPGLEELAGLISPSDARWAGPLLSNRDENGRNYIRDIVSFPVRAAAHGVRVFPIIDDIQNAALFVGPEFIAELAAVYSRARTPFVLSARRRLRLGHIEADEMHLERLEFRDVGSVTEKLASSARVTLNEEARDLIAVQTGGDLVLVRNIVHAARSGRASLENFRSVEKLYAEEITRGRTAAYFENAISSSLPDIAAQRRLVELLNFGLDAGGGRFMLEDWQKGLGIANEDFHRMVRALELEECIEVDSASARVTADNAFRDHITARYRLDHTGDTLTAVTAGLIASSLKRTPRIMAEFYRDKTSAGLAGLLAEFDCQEVPTALIDYERFKERFKGLSESEMRSGIAAETDHFQLPQIVHSSAATEFYPQLRDSIEPARTAFGTGFSDRNYSDDNETAWIAAEIDSKLEASRELTEFWCDRLERAAAANDVDNFRIWLVSPEGFSPEAIEALVHRNAIGSSRKQVELLKSFLAGELATVSSAATEYEITIPIGEDMELIAAHSLQEIAERYNFPPRSINQIKTALVEACINAAEHSHSPDRKIYQRFTVHDDRIVIVVSNRGIKLAGRRTSEVETVSGRRGWGLNLIKGLMDDVKFEQVDDGTRISMTKLLKRES